jgi:hypothetical protein
MTMIPEAAFIRLAGPDSDGLIEHTITIIQNHNRSLMEEWKGIYPIECIDNPDEPFWRETEGHRLVIPPNQGLKHELMNIWHEGSINGHITGLGAACRAGAHVSSATGQESVYCLHRGLVSSSCLIYL